MKDTALKFKYVDIRDKKFILINSEEWMQRNWVVGHYYEEKMLDYIRDNYSGGTFVDIGACMGNHTIYFSDIAESVVAFEPHKENYQHLLLNLTLNNITNVDTFNFGISDEPGIKTLFYSDKTYSNGNPTVEGPIPESNTSRPIAVMPLDALEIDNVSLIKIDVEGHNIPVLKGATKTIEMFKPVMFIECSTVEEFNKVYAFLKPLGYLPPKLVFNGTPTYLFSTEETVVPEGWKQ